MKFGGKTQVQYFGKTGESYIEASALTKKKGAVEGGRFGDGTGVSKKTRAGKKDTAAPHIGNAKRLTGGLRMEKSARTQQVCKKGGQCRQKMDLGNGKRNQMARS